MAYICKIANKREVYKKFNYEINHYPDEAEDWKVWQQQAVERHTLKQSITYIGVLDGEIISEGTAVIENGVEPNVTVIPNTVAYMVAFRTHEEYRNQGYLSTLHKFMMDDLKKRGYFAVIIGVEVGEEKNKAIYQKWGYTRFVRTGKVRYPNGEKITVEYYKKIL